MLHCAAMSIDWASFSPVPAVAGGLIIGLAVAMLVLLNGRVAGISGIVGGLLRPATGDIVQKLVEPGRSFDLVVIDTGSVARHPYVQPLAEAVDDIVFVARAGRSRKEDILAAVAGLNINARKIRGSVLTGAADDTA